MNYKVTHTQVGPWPEGRVLTEEMVAESVGNKRSLLNRLVSLGALTQTEEEPTITPLAVGPENPGQAEPEDEPIIAGKPMDESGPEPAAATAPKPAPAVVVPAKQATKLVPPKVGGGSGTTAVK